MLDGVAGIQHRRHLRQARGAALAAGLVAVWVLWWNPHLHQDDPRTLWPVPSLESQASPHQAVTDSLDFASDGSFDVPLAVVRSRCGMSTDDHVRPLTQGTVWDADTVPGGSDLIIENDGGRTRHCHVGYNRAARTTDENWADLGPRAAAVACAENDGVVARGVAPLRDIAGRLLEDAAFITFSGPGLPTVHVPVDDGVVVANSSWPLLVSRSTGDHHLASRRVTDYAVRVIDDDWRTLASARCTG